MTRTLDRSLSAKLVYFSNKLKLHDIVFNPFSDVVEKSSEEQAQTDGSPQSEELDMMAERRLVQDI